MNIADVSLAISMGIAAGVVIAGMLVIAWFLCSQRSAPHETLGHCTIDPFKNNQINLGEIEQ